MRFRQVVYFSIGPIGGAVLTFSALPIIAWSFSVEDIGRIALFQVFASLCLLLSTLGLDHAYVREYHESKNRFELFKNAFAPGFVLLLFFLGVLLLCENSIARFLFSSDGLLECLMVVIYIVLSYVLRFTSAALRMEERGLAFSACQILQRLVLLVVIVYFSLSDMVLNFIHLLTAHLIAILIGASVSVVQVRFAISQAWAQSLSLLEISNLLKFGAPLIMSGFAFWVLTSIDRVAIERYSTLDQVGFYSVAASLAAAAGILQNIFSTVWAPSIYKWIAKDERSEGVIAHTEAIFAIIALLFSMAGLLSWMVAYILPEEYNGIHYILVTCMAYPFFYTMSEATSIGIGIKRKNHYNMIAMTVSAFFCICLNLALTPTLGAVGAAVSMAISFWLLLVVRYEVSSRIWQPVISRWKLYPTSIAILFVTSLYSFLGESYPYVFSFLWAVVFLCCIVGFRKSLVHLIRLKSE